MRKNQACYGQEIIEIVFNEIFPSSKNLWALSLVEKTRRACFW